VSVSEISADRPALPWCVIWQAIEGEGDATIVARFLSRSDAITWIAVTAHAQEVATRCGVLGDIRVVLGYDGDDEGQEELEGVADDRA
jgi:hypothetical protein